MTPLRSWFGLARSLVIYRARPWKIARLARFYRSIVAPGDLAFDIGAHAGNRTRALAAAGARVVALEPQRLFHAFLRRDLPPGVTLLPLAAGAAPGRAELAVSRLHPTVSSLATGFAARMATAPGFAAVRWDAAETVELTTLDSLIAEHGLPRFVKIDVEGFEAEVLAGLHRPVPWVAFEYLPNALDLAAACVARLASLGRYEFNLVRGETAAFALPRWLGADAILPALAAEASDGRPGDVYARLADA
ncbi:MAG: FkbM family methyltransferase [Amaricoccus sp.]